jgi:hypothetical protein
LLVALGGLQARSLGQFMGSFQCLSIVAQHGGWQQQGSNILIALGGCLSQVRHQRRSLAARNALALCTGVILTIPTSHSMK